MNNNSFHNFLEVFFILGYFLIFIISIIILKPFRLHKKRKISTLSLKISYLIYLLIFLIFTYLLLFGEKTLDTDDIPYDSIFNIHFIIFLSSTIIPNAGIMLRKKIKNRTPYNLIFTFINISYSIYLFFLIITRKWALME